MTNLVSFDFDCRASERVPMLPWYEWHKRTVAMGG